MLTSHYFFLVKVKLWIFNAYEHFYILHTPIEYEVFNRVIEFQFIVSVETFVPKIIP